MVLSWLKGAADRLAIMLGSRPGEARPTAVAGRAAAFRVERRRHAVADLGPDDLRALIAELDARADEVGCVVFDGGTSTGSTTVIFAGNLERFHMLSVARHLAGRVVFVQDVTSWWYQGSDVLPDLDRFCREFLVAEVGSDRTIFFGQSSGAYAALVASTYVPGATAVACAPQTFSDAAVKAGIHFIGIRPLCAPAGLVDVKERLRATPDPNAYRAVVIAAGEVDNPASRHYWMDYLHGLRLSDDPDVDLFVVNGNSHAVVHRNAPIFARLLRSLLDRIDAPRAEKTQLIAAHLLETCKASG